MKESKDVRRAQDTVLAVQQRIQQLDADFRAETAALAARADTATEQLEQVSIQPARAGISIQFVALGWLPYWRNPEGTLSDAW